MRTHLQQRIYRMISGDNRQLLYIIGADFFRNDRAWERDFSSSSLPLSPLPAIPSPSPPFYLSPLSLVLSLFSPSSPVFSPFLSFIPTLTP